jgi:Na+/H+-dicarboxylate symporter
MNSQSPVDRMVLKGLAFCLLTAFLAGCIASAFLTIVSQTAKMAAKAASTATRISLDGFRAASHTLIRTFHKDENERAL